MHTLLDYDCLLPEFVNITDGKRSDNKATATAVGKKYSSKGVLLQTVNKSVTISCSANGTIS